MRWICSSLSTLHGPAISVGSSPTAKLAAPTWTRRGERSTFGCGEAGRITSCTPSMPSRARGVDAGRARLDGELGLPSAIETLDPQALGDQLPLDSGGLGIGAKDDDHGRSPAKNGFFMLFEVSKTIEDLILPYERVKGARPRYSWQALATDHGCQKQNLAAPDRRLGRGFRSLRGRSEGVGARRKPRSSPRGFGQARGRGLRGGRPGLGGSATGALLLDADAGHPRLGDRERPATRNPPPAARGRNLRGHRGGHRRSLRRTDSRRAAGQPAQEPGSLADALDGRRWRGRSVHAAAMEAASEGVWSRTSPRRRASRSAIVWTTRSTPSSSNSDAVGCRGCWHGAEASGSVSSWTCRR